jgi:hypothetical protein
VSRALVAAAALIGLAAAAAAQGAEPEPAPPEPAPPPAAEPAPPPPAEPVVAAAPLPAPVPIAMPEESPFERNFVGSVQLDYMLVPSHSIGRELGIDGATTELSLKLSQDLGRYVSSSIKLCVACHGLEVGMAFFDLRVVDQLNFRVGRFIPSFGEFPLRHDPANHRTSDKPLPYDMGRMLRIEEWNLGVLPSPWVDNGIEINGTHFFGAHAQINYAAYAISGPRSTANDPLDFDFTQSRFLGGVSYYADNNSRPTTGGSVSFSATADDFHASAGASAMTGTYDNKAHKTFRIYGAHANVRFKAFTLRGEYLWRRTELSTGTQPALQLKYGPRADGTYYPYFDKEGMYVELEAPIVNRVDAVLRWDGLHRVGNVSRGSALTDDAGVLRYTAGLTIAIYRGLRIKLNGEYYDFRDFKNEIALHFSLAGPF